MDGMSLIALLSLLLMLVLSAFFSASETALFASGRVRLTHLAERGQRGARRAVALVRDPAKILAVILVGNNAVNVGAAALATVLLGPVYATLVVTLALLVFAEIGPKTLASLRPEAVACRVSAPLWALSYAFRPVAWASSALVDLLLWPWLRGKRPPRRLFNRQEFLTALQLVAREGELEPAETRMAREVLRLRDLRVRQIMIPLDEVDAVPETASFEEVCELVSRSGATRYPVTRAEPGDMIGLLVIKDLLVHQEGARENWRQYVRPLMVCPASLEVDELLRDMQIQHSHLAAVEEDDGRVVGIVTMEDVLEEIVGEIHDEHDDPEGELIREVSADRYLVRGDAEVDDLCKVINVDLGPSDQELSLAEWFERRTPAGRGRLRRLKVGPVRVLQRGTNRFEILRKGRSSEARAQDEPPAEPNE
jgi:CBS domain containing-hemolysin-like protein